MAQVSSHLEQFHLSQEAAKCFDDDLDFCPSLTAKELSEIILASILAQKELQAKQQQRHQPHLHSPPRSPPHNSRAITIVDPTSRTPLYIPPSSAKGVNNTATTTTNKGMIGSGRYSAASTPVTSSGLMNTSNDYFNLMPTNSNANNSMGRTHNHSNHSNNNQQLFNSMYGSHAYAFSPVEQQQHYNHTYSMGMLSPTSVGSYSPPRQASRIPIVNPDNGRVVSVPEGPSSASWQQQHFVAVR
ncbi:hypothetical protein BGZ93_006581 [Podila epicladia]|nr:hypothetical protein BGZ92_007599 [Podila epicladia]KAG0094896.1 hypothetical protein BGZ93_006581 [Podila epicladia]